MKKLEELGISPWPWTFGQHIHKARFVVRNFLGKIIVGYTNNANARLIVAAPELYECLREAVIETCHNFECCGPAPEYACNGSKDCFIVKRWRSALAKAAGEEVAK